MASVDRQRHLPDEHWIIDGSSDAAIQRMLQTEPQPLYRRWNSEPDGGISDAFNKGVRRCTGDIVHILNSGDYYPDPEVLSAVVAAFTEHPERQWIHGQYYQYTGGRWRLTGAPMKRRQLYRGMAKIGHPTMFVRRTLYERYGLFRTDYRYAMDYDFLLRIAGEHYAWLKRPLSVFTPGGASQGSRQALRAFDESQRAYRERIGGDRRLPLRRLQVRCMLQLTDWLAYTRRRLNPNRDAEGAATPAPTEHFAQQP